MNLNFKEWINEADTFKPVNLRTPAYRDFRLQHGPGSRFNQNIPSLLKRVGSDIMTGHGSTMQALLQKYGGQPDSDTGYRDYFGDLEWQEDEGTIHFQIRSEIDPNKKSSIRVAVDDAIKFIQANEEIRKMLESKNVDIMYPESKYSFEDENTILVHVWFKKNSKTSDRLKFKKVV